MKGKIANRLTGTSVKFVRHAPYGNLLAMQRHVAAIVLYLLALSLRLAIAPFAPQAPFATFYPAAWIAFAVCGFGPGLLVVFLSMVTVMSLGVPAQWAWMQHRMTWVAIGGYALITILVGLLIDRSRIATRLIGANREQEKMLDNELVGIIKPRGGRTTWRNRAFCRMPYVLSIWTRACVHHFLTLKIRAALRVVAKIGTIRDSLVIRFVILEFRMRRTRDERSRISRP